MGTRGAAAAAGMLIAIAGCSGGSKGADAGRFEAPTPGAGVSTAGSLPTAAGRGLSPPSPARLFAGTASSVGELTHFCRNARCADGTPRTPLFLTVPARAFVVFTIGEAPLDAVAEIRVKASEKPATVQLRAGTLMYFDHGLGAGRYLVDLFVRWRSAEARWRFGLRVTA